jgi:hypothetical protein
MNETHEDYSELLHVLRTSSCGLLLLSPGRISWSIISEKLRTSLACISRSTNWNCDRKKTWASMLRPGSLEVHLSAWSMIASKLVRLTIIDVLLPNLPTWQIFYAMPQMLFWWSFDSYNDFEAGGQVVDELGQSGCQAARRWSFSTNSCALTWSKRYFFLSFTHPPHNQHESEQECRTGLGMLQRPPDCACFRAWRNGTCGRDGIPAWLGLNWYSAMENREAKYSSGKLYNSR